MKNSKRQENLESLEAVTHTHTHTQYFLENKVESANIMVKSIYLAMLLLVQIYSFGKYFYKIL